MISEPRLVGSPKILSESLLVEPPKILSEPPWSPFAMEQIEGHLSALRSEEAFTSTGLPKGEASEAFKKSTGPINRREYRFYRAGYRVNRRRNEGRNAFNSRDVLSQL
ncbi:hypothetical protein Tco_0045075 [Tanacetum coccineum]